MDDGARFLNLGCGEPVYHAARPWVNVDYRPEMSPDVVADLRALPFPDHSITSIYAGHVLEHVNPGNLTIVLGELRRVLEPAGALGVVGPDVGRAERAYDRGLISRERMTSAYTGYYRDHGHPHLWESTEAATAFHLVTAGWRVTTASDRALTANGWPVVGISPDQFGLTAVPGV